MPTRWYIGRVWAEDEAFFPVELTDTELEAVRKFERAMKHGHSTGFYCGSFDMIREDDGSELVFNSKEECDRYIVDELL